jgi:hypothetical protein
LAIKGLSLLDLNGALGEALKAMLKGHWRMFALGGS